MPQPGTRCGLPRPLVGRKIARAQGAWARQKQRRKNSASAAWRFGTPTLACEGACLVLKARMGVGMRVCAQRRWQHMPGPRASAGHVTMAGASAVVGSIPRPVAQARLAEPGVPRIGAQQKPMGMLAANAAGHC